MNKADKESSPEGRGQLKSNCQGQPGMQRWRDSNTWLPAPLALKRPLRFCVESSEVRL